MIKHSVKNILRIDSSARQSDSITRQLGDKVVERLLQKHQDANVVIRDLSDKISFVDESWVQANMADPDERDPKQQMRLTESDHLVRELTDADIVVLTAPIYNFSVPAALKAWIDMICRARETFHYTEEGPVGLLTDRPAYLVMASGGVPFGSPADFASDYLRHIFSFIGINDLRLIYAEATNSSVSTSENSALKILNQWLPETVTATVA